MLGLLECPIYEGWIEFTFDPGDKISDLTARIDARWATHKRSDRVGYLRSAAWVFFCAREGDEYVAMCKDEAIPTKPPTACKRAVGRFGSEEEEEYLEHLLFHGTRIDVFFLDGSLWNSADGLHERDKPVEFTQNFTVRLPTRRTYDVPEDKQFDVRLVAIKAIVGG